MAYDRNRLASFLGVMFDNLRVGTAVGPKHRRVKIFAGGGTSISVGSGTDQQFVGTIPGDAPSLSLVDEGVDAFDDFIEEAMRDPEIENLVGVTALSKQLDHVLRSSGSQRPQGPLSDFVRFSILKPLKSAVSSLRCVLPVVNFDIEETIDCGAVRFYTRAAVTDLIQQWLSAHEFHGDSDEERQSERRLCENALGDMVLQTHATFVVVDVRCHPSRASDAAIYRALRAINCLRALCYLQSSRDSRPWIGLPRAIRTVRWGSFIYDEKVRCFNLNGILDGPLLAMELKEQQLRHLHDKCHFDALLALLRQTDEALSDFDVALLASFQAIGRGVIAGSHEFELLSYTTALERLFFADREMVTTEKFVDRVALWHTSQSDTRRRMIAEGRRLYDYRSRIVHAGFVGVAEIDVATMYFWAIGCLLQALGQRQEFASHRAFVDHVENLKY